MTVDQLLDEFALFCLKYQSKEIVEVLNAYMKYRKNSLIEKYFMLFIEVGESARYPDSLYRNYKKGARGMDPV